MNNNTTSKIILFPGQGAQHVGMGGKWAEASPAATEIYRRADEILGMELSKICFEGPEDQVHRTDIAQAAIYVTSLACCAALEDRGELDMANVAATAGLSLGEYTALHAAGVFGFEDGLKLVRMRGQFMQEAAQSSDGSMVAIIGADEDQANKLCDAARGDDVLVPANFNCPGQIVISGSACACERAITEAGTMGLRATALTVAGAFHSDLMAPAAEQMARAIKDVQFASPRVAVLSNVTGQRHESDTEAIKKRLVEQITHPVRWEHNVRWLVENANGSYIEPAPGKVLTGMMRRIDRKTKVTSYAIPG